MERDTVKSSMISSVGYDPEGRILEIEFNSGKVYQYLNVSPETYSGLMQADSKGSYMLACIIDCYPTREIRNTRR